MATSDHTKRVINIGKHKVDNETFLFLVDRVAIFLLVFLSRFSWCLSCAFTILVITNAAYHDIFLRQTSLSPDTWEYDDLFWSERIALGFIILSYSFGNKYCWMMGTCIYLVTNIYFIASSFNLIEDMDKGEEVKKDNLDQNQDSRTTNHEAEPMATVEEHQNKEEEEEEEEKSTIKENKENSLKEDCAPCRSLKLEIKILSKELKQTAKSLKHYKKLREINLNDHDEWDLEKNYLLEMIESLSNSNPNLVSEDAAAKNYQNAVNRLAESQRKWEEERRDLESKLEEAKRWINYYHSLFIHLAKTSSALTAERSHIYPRLIRAESSAVSYRMNCDRKEEKNRQLEEELCEVLGKLIVQTTSCEHLDRVVNELGEKNRRLEEEKVDLTAKLSAAMTAAELHRSYLMNDVVPINTTSY